MGRRLGEAARQQSRVVAVASKRDGLAAFFPHQRTTGAWSGTAVLTSRARPLTVSTRNA
jgi:hypothetical protein